MGSSLQSYPSNAPDVVKVRQNKPAAAADGCYTKSLTPQFIAETQTFSSQPDSQCNALWPSYSVPRIEAGGPLDANVLKCQLKPVDPGDYALTFTPDELTKLNSIFPSGVCDWSKRGINEVSLVPWASFGPAPEDLVFDGTNP